MVVATWLQFEKCASSPLRLALRVASRTLNLCENKLRLGCSRSNKLKPDMVLDLTHNTEFTDDEIRQWYKGFLKDCPDGQLRIEKFKEIYAGFFPHGKFC